MIEVVVEITYLAVFYPQFWAFLLIVVTSTLLVLAIRESCNNCYSQCFLRHTSTSKKRWLKDATENKKIKIVNSSNWKGNYTQDGDSFFIPDFDFTVDKSGSITGKGKDNIGHYKLEGKQVNDRVALTKTYIPDQNAFHNRGHQVKILMTVTAQNRLEGRWSINSETYREGQMTFYSI